MPPKEVDPMSDFFRDEKKQREDEPHPAWRGIGFLLLIGIPILSFLISTEVVAALVRNGFVLPEELQRPPQEILGMGPFANLPAILVFGVLIAAVLFGIFAIVNAMIYGASAGNTYRAFESPPEKFKKKRKLKKRRFD
jgi:hypothetical protein